MVNSYITTNLVTGTVSGDPQVQISVDALEITVFRVTSAAAGHAAAPWALKIVFPSTSHTLLGVPLGTCIPRGRSC